MLLQLIDKFLNEMRGRWTPQTIQRYAWFLKDFYEWVVVSDLPDDPKEITRDDIIEWLDDNSQWANSTQHVAITAARAFFRWSVGNKNSPARRIKSPKRYNVPHRFLSEDQVEKILSSLDTSTLYGTRNTAIMLLALDTGLRASEICNLKLKNLNLSDRSLYVPTKGGNWQKAVFSEYTTNALSNWLAWRSKAAAKDTDTVFCSVKGAKPGSALTREGLRVICRKIGQRAGFHFSPHDLRRTCGTWAIKQGASTRMVQILLRIKTLALVETYSPGVEADDLAPYSPVNRLMNINRKDEKLQSQLLRHDDDQMEPDQ